MDIVMVVVRSDSPFIRRAASFPYEELPVPANPLVYTPEEWAKLPKVSEYAWSGKRFGVYERQSQATSALSGSPTSRRFHVPRRSQR